MSNSKPSSKSSSHFAEESKNGTTSMSSDWHMLSPRQSVRFSFNGIAAGLTAEWQPKRPSKEEFLRIHNSYSRARNEFLNQLSAKLGLRLLCVELPL